MSDSWKPATKLVHCGTHRSEHGETSEALYLTQGFVYDSAEAAEARFKGDEDGYIYSRYKNPTVAMFEERMCALEGADAALATASGMGAVTAALMCQLKAGDHIVAARALFGSCRWVVEKLCPQYGIEATLVDGRDLDAWQTAIRPNTKVLFLESPTNPTLELVDIAAVAALAEEYRRAAGGGQCFRHADPAEAAGTGRPCRRLFRHQAYRRAGALSGRRRAGRPRFHQRDHVGLFPPHRPVAFALQRLGVAEGAGDLAAARGAADGDGRSAGRFAGRSRWGRATCAIPAGPTFRRPTLPRGR